MLVVLDPIRRSFELVFEDLKPLTYLASLSTNHCIYDRRVRPAALNQLGRVVFCLNGEELMLALITDRRSRLRRSGVIRHGLQRSNVDPMPSGADTNGHATASLTYAALVKDAYSQVPRGITKTRNSSVPPPTLPTEGKHSPSHRPRIPSMDNSSERALAR